MGAGPWVSGFCEQNCLVELEHMVQAEKAPTRRFRPHRLLDRCCLPNQFLKLPKMASGCLQRQIDELAQYTKLFSCSRA